MEKNLQILTWKPFTYQVTKYKSSKKKNKKKKIKEELAWINFPGTEDWSKLDTFHLRVRSK